MYKDFSLQILEAKERLRAAFRISLNDSMTEVLNLAVTKYMRQGGGTTDPQRLTIRSGLLASAIRDSSNIRYTDSESQLAAEKSIQDSSGALFPYAHIQEQGLSSGWEVTPKQRRFFIAKWLESGDIMWFAMFKSKKLKRPKRPFLASATENIDLSSILIRNISDQFPDSTTEVVIGEE